MNEENIDWNRLESITNCLASKCPPHRKKAIQYNVHMTSFRRSHCTWNSGDYVSHLLVRVPQHIIKQAANGPGRRLAQRSQKSSQYAYLSF